MAYIRDSWSGSSAGDIQAAMAALAAFAFQSVTASALATGDPPALRKNNSMKNEKSFFIQPPRTRLTTDPWAFSPFLVLLFSLPGYQASNTTSSLLMISSPQP